VPFGAAIDAALAAEGQWPNLKKSFLKRAQAEKKDDFESCFLVLRECCCRAIVFHPLIRVKYPQVSSPRACQSGVGLRSKIGK
jgi:hypothetical protein